MGTNFSPGILLTCFFVVGQQSCLSIVLQKSRLNKAIFSCAFQHKKSVLFSTEKAHTGVRRITVTVKDCNHPPRRVLTKCRKKEGTWSAAGLQVPWPQNDAELVERCLRLDLQLWSCVCDELPSQILWSKIPWGITLITNDSISVEPMARLLRNRKWPRTWISDEWSCCSSQIKIGETTSVCDELDWGSSQNHTVFKTLDQFFTDSFHTCAWGTGWFVMNLSQVHHKSRFLWIGHFVMNNHVVLICDEPQSSSSQITGWD